MSIELSWLPTDLAVSSLCLLLSGYLYANYKTKSFRNKASNAYILSNQVVHARLLPTESKHAFTYPTTALLLSLKALESKKLDLWFGRLFGYGDGLKILGLRSTPYLAQEPVPSTIHSKLQTVLRSRGYSTSSLEDTWIMTMPSIMGFEGINPLTVYFCYKPKGELWLTILEIHNTFGETHVHVLEVGKLEDSSRSDGFDHQWTFRREFHVSPFNDRLGYYTVSVSSPSHSPSVLPISPTEAFVAPRPVVRVHLHTSSKEVDTPGPLKLSALFRPVASVPMTASSLIVAMIHAPLGLFLSMPRILYNAWILHYNKRLDVYLRPEPYPVHPNWGENTGPSESAQVSKKFGGVKWLSAGFTENFSRKRLEGFLGERVNAVGISVTLVGPDPSDPPEQFSTSSADGNAPHLTISYLSPRFFTIMFGSPSAEHALLLGCDTERMFVVSSRELFLRVFDTSGPSKNESNDLSYLQRQRLRSIPSGSPISFTVPNNHTLDEKGSNLPSLLVIWVLLSLDWLEQMAFSITRARIVKGQEPWKQWERAGTRVKDDGSGKRELHVDASTGQQEYDNLGSVRNES